MKGSEIGGTFKIDPVAYTGSAVRAASRKGLSNRFNELLRYSNVDDMEPANQREMLVLQYRGRARRLALGMMKKWRSRIEKDEFESIVDLSLCEAAKLFKPGIGCSFTSYLFYHLFDPFDSESL